MNNVLLVLNIGENRLKKSDLSAVTAARTASSYLKGSFSILALGEDLLAVKSSLVSLGAQKVYFASLAGGVHNLSESCVWLAEKVAKQGDFKLVLTPSTSFGRDIMPQLAAKFGAGMVSEVTDITFESNRFFYTHPVYAGNIEEFSVVNTPLEFATVRTIAFNPASFIDDKSERENIESSGLPEVLKRLKFIDFEKVSSKRPDLTEASIVVTGGRGVKNREGFELIEKLADSLGGAVGATRAAVDAGFVHNDFQIGQTGKIVAPDIYFAIGVHGALQHTAGIRSSKIIVAINKDPDAPVFKIADYGIIGDLFKIVPEVIEEFNKF
jgi:electron transfer flavoprotein alpha subunit